jgi:hypothetical protein
MTTARLAVPGGRASLRPLGHRPMGPELRQIAAAALRSSLLIAIAMLLILVMLPVALGAAWTQVAVAP